MMKSIGFIGAGNMAAAIIGGISKSNIGARIYAYDLDCEKLEQLKQYGAEPAKSATELAKSVDYLLLAVKPQNITVVLTDIAPDIRRNVVIISIAAGITEGYISKMLGYPAKVVQVMPNTPLMLSCGATAISKSDYVSEEEFAFVKRIFDCAGVTAVIPREKMNEVIPINGSSPAFIYQFAKGFVEYGKAAGIDEAICLKLFSQSLIGSAKMLTDSGYTIEQLITMVSSKGGTTIAGLEGLRTMQFDTAIKTACEQCVARAYELTLE